jgi:hypothetical protein
MPGFVRLCHFMFVFASFCQVLSVFASLVAHFAKDARKLFATPSQHVRNTFANASQNAKRRVKRGATEGKRRCEVATKGVRGNGSGWGLRVPGKEKRATAVEQSSIRYPQRQFKQGWPLEVNSFTNI